MGDFTDACGGGGAIEYQKWTPHTFYTLFWYKHSICDKKKNIHIVCIEIPGGAKTLKIFFYDI